MSVTGPVWVNTSVRPRTVVLTERAHTDHAGAGLGPAVVTTITHAHDGTLTLTPRSAGGIRITVELPACDTGA